MAQLRATIPVPKKGISEVLHFREAVRGYAHRLCHERLTELVTAKVNDRNDHLPQGSDKRHSKEEAQSMIQLLLICGICGPRGKHPCNHLEFPTVNALGTLLMEQLLEPFTSEQDWRRRFRFIAPQYQDESHYDWMVRIFASGGLAFSECEDQELEAKAIPKFFSGSKLHCLDSSSIGALTWQQGITRAEQQQRLLASEDGDPPVGVPSAYSLPTGSLKSDKPRRPPPMRKPLPVRIIPPRTRSFQAAAARAQVAGHQVGPTEPSRELPLSTPSNLQQIEALVSSRMEANRQKDRKEDERTRKEDRDHILATVRMEASSREAAREGKQAQGRARIITEALKQERNPSPSLLSLPATTAATTDQGQAPYSPESTDSESDEELTCDAPTNPTDVPTKQDDLRQTLISMDQAGLLMAPATPGPPLTGSSTWNPTLSPGFAKDCSGPSSSGN